MRLLTSGLAAAAFLALAPSSEAATASAEVVLTVSGNLPTGVTTTWSPSSINSTFTSVDGTGEATAEFGKEILNHLSTASATLPSGSATGQVLDGGTLSILNGTNASVNVTLVFTYIFHVTALAGADETASGLAQIQVTTFNFLVELMRNSTVGFGTERLEGTRAFEVSVAANGSSLVSISSVSRAEAAAGIGVIPLPAAGWLLLGALGLLAGLRRRPA